MSKKIVPTVNLSQFVNGTAAERDAFVKELGGAFETVGFVAVAGHGISADLIADFYKDAKAFFANDVETKKRYEVNGLAGQRGYTSFGKEHAKQSNVGDLKEFFQIGQDPDNEADRAIYPPNVHTDIIPTFTEEGAQLYKAFELAGAHLLRAVALHLDLGEEYFTQKIANGNSILRAIHYPPITAEPLSAIRAEQHEDINLITLLVGASAGGLELLTMDNEWVAVVPEEGEIVINVGDMLQRLTNNHLKSTTHRVVNPPRAEWHTARLSIPFFLHPRSEMDLSCLEKCVTASNPIAYEPITAGDYLDERLREIGLKK
jgi:isopenicillin N synthase-like dioxygenase